MTSTQADLAARVAATRERLALDAEVWNPAKQPEQQREIAGLVVERRTLPGAGHNGADAEQMVVQESPDRCWRFRLYGQVLQNELAGVDVGDVVAIRYDGWVTKPGVKADGSANGYHGWSVTHDRGGQPARPSPLPAAVIAETVAPTEPVEEIAEAPRRKLKFCPDCGTLEPDHAEGCSSDIPF